MLPSTLDILPSTLNILPSILDMLPLTLNILPSTLDMLFSALTEAQTQENFVPSNLTAKGVRHSSYDARVIVTTKTALNTKMVLQRLFPQVTQELAKLQLHL